MHLDPQTLLALVALGLLAGGLGAVIGIGGGVVLVPALILGFDVEPHVAVATSLVGVVATSTAAGGVYVGSGLTNMRLGMTLEVATTLGGITGGLLAGLLSPNLLSGLFGVLMGVTAVLTLRGKDVAAQPSAEALPPPATQGWEALGTLAGAYWDQYAGEMVTYRARRLAMGGAVSLLAGIISGLLGVGGGFVKVPAMTLGMGVPIRVATATSNFMVGVTAISSLFIYFARGHVQPALVAPVALGVVVGSLSGTHLAGRLAPRTVRWILGAVLAAVAVQMLLRAVGHGG